MAKTPEGKVKDQVKALLKRLGIWYFMPATGGFGRSGVHDFICCWHGRFIAIETKAPGKIGNLTAMQVQADIEVRGAGGLSFVCDDVSALESVLVQSMGSPA
jgi:hypothetical protein